MADESHTPEMVRQLVDAAEAGYPGDQPAQIRNVSAMATRLSWGFTGVSQTTAERIARMRQTWREITTDDGGECQLMADHRWACDEIERLRGWLRYIEGHFRDHRQCAEEALRGDAVPSDERKGRDTA